MMNKRCEGRKTHLNCNLLQLHSTHFRNTSLDTFESEAFESCHWDIHKSGRLLPTAVCSCDSPICAFFSCFSSSVAWSAWCYALWAEEKVTFTGCSGVQHTCLQTPSLPLPTPKATHNGTETQQGRDGTRIPHL